MRLLECSRCGSKELLETDGYFVCIYCQSRFKPEVDEAKTNGAATAIDFRSDIQALLKKCAEDPTNRRRYVNLILDIDPYNREVKQFL